MTTAERLQHKCPNCNALPGDPCRDIKGDETKRPHKIRGPGQHEKHIQERIDRQTARAKKSYGPLFQAQADAEVQPPTVAEVMIRDRLAVARSFDDIEPNGCALLNKANAGLHWMTIHRIFHEIDRRCGDNWGRALRESILNGFGNDLSYLPSRMRELMTTTKPRVIAYFRHAVSDSLIGVRLEPAMTWAPEEPLMTVAEFEERFPFADHFRGLRGPTNDHEPDDGGLFDVVMTVFQSQVPHGVTQ